MGLVRRKLQTEKLTDTEEGPAGMVALKEFRDLGFDVTVFEKKDNVGGAWCWSEDAASTTALRETKLCNNKYSVGAARTLDSIVADRMHVDYVRRLPVSKWSVAE